MLITSVEKEAGNRLSIYINDEYAFSISEEDYIRLGLYEKKEITREEILHIKLEVNLRSARASGIKFLALKLRTESEVRKRLSEQGFDENIIDCTISALKDSQYIDDMLYCKKYISCRLKLKPGSRKMLQYELEQKGIDRKIIWEAFQEFDIDEISIAASMIQKKYGRYDPEDEKTLKKLYNFLYNKGFSYEIINAAIKRIKSYKD